MKWPFTLTSRHVAELAAKDRVIAEKDETIAATRASRAYHRSKAMTLGAVLRETREQLEEASLEIERLRKYEPVRDPVTNRFVGKGTRLPRQDSYAGPDAARAAAFAQAGKVVRHG